jgi:RND family efflux transporter MFP subunit
MAQIFFLFAFLLPSITEASELPRVDVIQLQEQFMTRHLYLDGTLHPHRNTALSPEVSGVLIGRRVNIGARVTQGDTLLQVDPQRYMLKRTQRSAELNAARSRARLSEQTWQRVNRLYGDDTATEEELQRATFNRDSANAHKRSAKTALKVAQLDLEKTVLRAPFDGEIAAVHGEIGQTVAAGHPLLHVASTETLIVRTSVSAREVQWLEVGLPALVTPSDDSAPFKTTLRSFAQVADPQSRRYIVELVSPNRVRRSFGALASIELTTNREVRGVLVSENALRSFAGTTYAYVVEEREGTAFLTRRAVSISLELPDGLFLISEGLTPGERVAAGGALMVDGLQIQPSETRVITAESTP